MPKKLSELTKDDIINNFSEDILKIIETKPLEKFTVGEKWRLIWTLSSMAYMDKKIILDLGFGIFLEDYFESTNKKYTKESLVNDMLDSINAQISRELSQPNLKITFFIRTFFISNLLDKYHIKT